MLLGHPLGKFSAGVLLQRLLMMAKENRGPEVEAVAILFLILAWVFVALRCYVRIFMIKSFGTDDWLAVFALVSTFSTPNPTRSFCILSGSCLN